MNLDFIPKDGRMKQVIQVVQTPSNTLLMTDFEANSIWEYGLNGQYIRTLVSTAQLGFPTAPGVSRGLQGLCIADGKVWFTFNDTVGTGADNRNAIWSVNLDGSGLQIECSAQTTTRLGQLRSITPFGSTPGDFLVGDSGGDDLEFLGAGCGGSTWHDSNGNSGINYPQQICVLPPGSPVPLRDGVVLVTGFTAPAGLYLYDANGSELFVFSTFTSPRGVHPLDNGEWIYTGGTLVRALDPSSGVDRLIIDVQGPAGSFRWVSRIELPAACPGDLDESGAVDAGDIGALLLSFGDCPGQTPGCDGDLDSSGSVDAGDIGFLLTLFGPC